MLIEMQTVTSTTEDGTNMSHAFEVKQTVEEHITDFHLFCISIVRDLINNKSHINGESFIYNFDFTPDPEEDDNEGEEWKTNEQEHELKLEEETPWYVEDTVTILDYMSDVIFRERSSFNKELENLLK